MTGGWELTAVGMFSAEVPLSKRRLSLIISLCFVLHYNKIILYIFQVEMSKVNLEVIKPWITKRVTEILGFEDDVVIDFIFNQLEVKVFLIEGLGYYFIM